MADGRVVSVKGGDNPYTAGVICAKVSRYGERVHHPDRILQPLERVGPKGSGQWRPIAWDAALDRLAALGLGGSPRRAEVSGVAMAVVWDPDDVPVELVDTGASANLERLATR